MLGIALVAPTAGRADEPKLAWVDPAVAQPWAEGRNPIYVRLEAAQAAAEAKGVTYTPRQQAVIEANLARAKLLPPDFGRRFILVDAAAGQLWLFDDGEVRANMRVVTGKPTEQTPLMIGEARELIFQPYWNVPDDLVRKRVAPKAIKGGPLYIGEANYEIYSDYTDDAQRLDPSSVDWPAVAKGKESVRVRQRPGKGNMMGQVKLMLPNPLGIYLHDTPMKGLFNKDQRQESSGCIRLEDAVGLARALVGDEAVDDALEGGDESHVALAEPVPVYVVYFTAWPDDDGGIVFRKDVYGRDPGGLPKPKTTVAKATTAPTKATAATTTPAKAAVKPKAKPPQIVSHVRQVAAN